MIRFLQRDSRVVKAFFVVVIAAASVGMVVYLIPGLTGLGASPADTYATIYPHWYSRLLSSGVAVSQEHVEKIARQQMQQQRYPDNPVILGLIEQRVGQQLVRQQVLLEEAGKLGIHASNADVNQFLHKGQFGALFFPNGNYIGDDRYAAFVANQFNISVPEFEDEVRQEIVVRRLEALVTAGVTVSDQEVRESYLKNNIKIKFDYAVISADDLRKTINPSDADLEAFFKKNGARYATAVPEERRVTYFAFTPNELPGGVPQPTQEEIKQYFDEHQPEYSVPEQARARHILIKVAPGADAKTDAAAKAKAEGILKQIQGAPTLRNWPRNIPTTPAARIRAGNWALRSGHHGAGVRQGHLHAKDRRHRDCEEPVRLSHCAGGRAAGRRTPVAERGAAHDSGHADPGKGGAAEDIYAQR